MKYLKYILIVALLFGCKKAVVDTDEERLFVSRELENVSIQEGISQYMIDISGVFSVYSNSNAFILKSIQSVQNENLVTAEINGEMLELTIHTGQTGSTEITLRAEYASTVVYESFMLTVTPVSANTAMNEAIQHFQNAEYSDAETMFLVVISKNNSQLQSDAYMGLGFSQMRLDRADEAYQALQASLNENLNNYDAQAGLSLLEYAFRRNYSEAIRIGQQLLVSSPEFVFRYDTSLDKNDIRLNIALSQFAALLFNDCLATVQILDPSYVLSPNDPDFQSKLSAKLEELINLYS